MAYIYLGDRHTDPVLKGKACTAMHRPDGKCIRSRMATMLVEFPEIGKQHIINVRMLRKIKNP